VRALTLWRPWDTAILYLGKPIENRDWAPPPSVIGQRIALHSGKKFDEAGAVKVVELARFHGITDKVIELMLDRSEKLDSVILGTVRIGSVLSRAQLAFGTPDPLATSPWFFGAFGWVCEEPIAFQEPVPCKGAQGLWTLPPHIEAAVLAQEAAHAR
jgi:hypothetical protein